LKNIANERKMGKAIRKLNNNGKYNSKIYEFLKINFSYSEESKLKMSQTRKNLIKEGIIDMKGKNNPIFGMKSMFKNGIYEMVPAENTNSYLSDGWIFKGKPKPQSLKDKLSKIKTGSKLSESHKKNIGNALRGIKKGERTTPVSAITKEKISKQSKGRIWYSNLLLQKTRFLKLEDILVYESEGWIKGRKKFN
jgi:hypothetical protein